MASSSSSSPPAIIGPHDVFLSFRGEDVRRKFRSHFLKELGRKLIAFKDDEIEKGQSIGPELINAIRRSRISVVALSHNFANSSWCLDELVEIMKCRKERGLIVIPIFYDVDPSHVKKQTHGFGEIFVKTCQGRTEEEKLEWQKALTEAATIAGEDSQNWSDEAKLIEKIVNDVSNKLISTKSNDFADFVGLEDHIKKMNSLLNLESDKVIMVGIWGPSGVGKTTIGRALFSQLSCQFLPSIFIDKTKENYTRAKSVDYNTHLYLQSQFLAEVLDQDTKIHGLRAVEERLGHKKVLVVFDDLDDQVLLNALVGKTTWFGPSSRIVVISKDRELLRAHGIESALIYEVASPSEELAFQMFCRCAFGQDSPPDDVFLELATEAVKFTGNLPLCLNVLGKSLAGLMKEEWEERMPKLRDTMAGQIDKTLRDSYNRLKEEDKATFLHIACLFNHKPRDYVIRLLEDSKLGVDVGLVTLAERCLIQISEDKIIRMHDFLQNMGREIVRQPCLQRPGERQFLMDSKEICDVLLDETGTESVLGIFLNLSEIEDTFSISKKAFRRMKNLQFLSIYGVLQEDIEVIPPLQGGKDHMWRQLRLLEWWGCPLRCMPPNIRPENLVELRMPDSHLETLWQGVQLLKRLKKMDLRRSKKLKEIPDLSKATNLEELYLEDCWSLVLIPPSIQTLHRLRKLDMKRCKNLQSLPTNIHLESLHSLNFSGCSQLRSFPQISRNISYLFLDETEIEEVPGRIEDISGLNYILMNGCSNLKYISPNISKLKHLKVMFFSNSPSAVETTTNNIHTPLPDATPSRNWKNDVFVSFQGEDVRKTLLSHLYNEFRRNGITTFRDDGIVGKDRSTLLARGIRESRIVIVVLSNDYAYSNWRLDELVEIIKCRKEIGQKVIPIFYGVDLVHIRKQIFNMYHSVDEQQKWLQAFTVLNQLQGYHSRNWASEAGMIEKLAIDICLALNITPKDFSDVLVDTSWYDSPSAVETIANNIHTQLPDGSPSRNWKNDVFVSFHGPDVRKTLLSHLYNEFGRKGITTFKDDNTKRGAGPDTLVDTTTIIGNYRSTLLARGIRESRIVIVLLSNNYVDSTWCLDELVNIIKCRKEVGQKVIPIFYGVDLVHIMEKLQGSYTLAKKHKWLPALLLNQVQEFYTVDQTQKWLQAFTILSQLQGYHSWDWVSDAEMIEKIAVDISFALNITPKEFSDVAGREMLPRIVDQETEKTLKLHYNGLHQKERVLFRHIACFLNNETYENVTRLLENSELDVGSSLKILFEKSLIQISEERVISMHHVLQTIGRDIALGSFTNQPAHRQFLMDTSEGCDVLIDETGAENVFGISFNVSEMEDRLRRDERFKEMKKLQFMRMYKESLYGKEVRVHLVKGLHSLWERLGNI